MHEDHRKPDSIRRARSRRAERIQALHKTVKSGRDPFLFTVEGRKVRRRLRRPRVETEARIRELQEQGLARPVIADQLGLSDDYVRRVLKRLEGDR